MAKSEVDVVIEGAEEAMEVNEVPVGTLLHLETSGEDTHIVGVEDPEIEYIVGDLIDASHVQDGGHEGTYIFNQETGEIQLIDFNVATTIDNNEVEIVTVDGNKLFSDYQGSSSNNVQIIDRNFGLQRQSTSVSATSTRRKVQQNVTVSNIPAQSSSPTISRLKSAPALLRNSRRIINSGNSTVGSSTVANPNNNPGTGKVVKGKSGKPAPRSKPKPKLGSQVSNKGRRQVVFLQDDSNVVGQFSHVLEASQNVAVENSSGEAPSGFLIYQNAGGDQVAELVADGTYINQADNNSVVYQLDNDNNVIFLHDISVSNVPTVSLKAFKRTKPVKKVTKKKASSVDVPKKANRGGGASELKCMEKGCLAMAYNVSELRKHLTNFHDMSFDLERREFESDTVFKEWRQHYERDRMVSFIYRGGTKKISKDQSVTYMICHRSGHYKPTMADTAKRQRKMKPQGSCKIGGYCTAGIKLLKNLETGSIQADICHTHYGHPLDSEAIPHLRVNPVLKRLIVKKFEEGMNFADMLAYIHHNPDGLEGLRVVDRRAIRNIYDTWKKAPNPDQEQLSKEPDEIPDQEILLSSSSMDLDNSSPVPIQLATSEVCLSHPITNLRNIKKKIGSQISTPAPLEDQVVVEELAAPILYAVNDEPYEDSSENLVDEGPPLLIAIDSVKSLKPSEKAGSTTLQKRSKLRSKSKSGKRLKGSTSTAAAVVKKPEEKSVIVKTESMDVTNSKATSQQRLTLLSSKTNSTEKKEIKDDDTTSLPSENLPPVTTPPPSQQDDSDEDYFDFMQIHISPELETTIDKLHNHGEAGPSILLYKRIGETNTKYGGFCRAFREDDFCLIIQTPVQRQIFQLFPKIVSIEILHSPKPNEHGLKLAFISVLDDFREAIPVAWMIADSMCPRYLNQFFRMLRYHCGELPVLYIMAPRNAEIFKSWTAHFSHKPKMLQSEFSVKRDLRTLLNRHFPNDCVRTSAWNIVENFVHEKYIDNLKTHKKELDKISKRSVTGSVYLRKMEKDWLCRIKEWSFAYRVSATANLLFAAEGFLKLRKFVGFKGTRRLGQSIDHILKIGYDKCFLRTKRMFKGDQKLSNLLEKVDEFHKLAVTSLEGVMITEIEAKQVWKIESSEAGEQAEEVFHLQSPCDCKIRCKICNICMHEYICTCKDFCNLQVMCAHIHKVHCWKNNISLQMNVDEQQPLQQESSSTSAAFSQLQTKSENEAVITVTETNPSLSAATAGICDGSEITIINENDMEDFNIAEVLGFLGQQSVGIGGHDLPKIVSITDVDTQKVLYDGSINNASPLTIFQLDSDD